MAISPGPCQRICHWLGYQPLMGESSNPTGGKANQAAGSVRQWRENPPNVGPYRLKVHAQIMRPHISASVDSKRSCTHEPAQSPTLQSPTRSAITAGLRGSSSGFRLLFYFTQVAPRHRLCIDAPPSCANVRRWYERYPMDLAPQPTHYDLGSPLLDCQDRHRWVKSRFTTPTL